MTLRNRYIIPVYSVPLEDKDCMSQRMVNRFVLHIRALKYDLLYSECYLNATRIDLALLRSCRE
jgi:hypothetical protein